MVLPAMVAAGMETVVAYLVRGLAARGHEVGVTCLESVGELGETMIAEGHRVSVVRLPGVRTNFFPRALESWFRELRPDVVHTHNGVWLKGARAARRSGRIPVVNTLHGTDGDEPWYVGPYSRLAAAHTATVAVVSGNLVTYLRQLGVPQHRIIVVANGVSTERFRPGERAPAWRPALDIPADHVVIGNVARFRAVKNHALLIEAFAKLRATVPATLVLVGEGPMRDAIEARVDALGIREHVRMLGLADDTAPIYRELDLFVLSSFSEGTSMSILEAMASGVPVIATAVGGTPALVRHGECAVLTPSGDVDAMAEAMRELCDDEGRRAALSRAGRACVEASHGAASMIDRYEAIYDALVGARAHGEAVACAE